MQDEYSELEKQGYVVVGQFHLRPEGMTTITLHGGQVKQANAMKQRHDKLVVVRDSIGTIGKSSPILFGYNKKGIKLSDGEYVSATELLAAMTAAITNLEKGTKVVNSKGKVLDPEELLRVVKETAGAVIIRDKISTQNAYHWSIKGAEKGPEVKKGVTFVGNNVPLGTGDYVNLDEFLKALEEYVVIKPKEPEPTPLEPKEPEPTPLEPKKPHVARVVKKYKNRASKWLIILAILATLLSGFKTVDVYKTVEDVTEVETVLVTKEKRDDLMYYLQSLDLEGVELDDAVLKEILSKYDMGDYARVEDGDTLTTQGNLTGESKTVGQEFGREGKYAGDYAITGIAIVHNGQVIDYIESFNLEDKETNLAEFVMKACDEHGVNFEDVLITVHMGSNQELSRLGWINAAEIFDSEELSEEAIKRIAEKGSTYNGTIENFSGDTITLENGVTIKVTDANGNLLEPGSMAIGSDGRQYIISDLALETVSYQTEETVMVEQTEQKEVKVGKKLTWRIQDCNLAVGLAPLVAALAYAVYNKRRNDKLEESPTILGFEDDQEYEKFKAEFIKRGEEYHKKSRFIRTLKRIFISKEVDLLQNLTEEQIRELYNAIKSLNTPEYRYESTDSISLNGGHIMATKQDGTVINITDIVLPIIADIGKGNKVEAEGMLEHKETENGTRKK